MRLLTNHRLILLALLAGICFQRVAAQSQADKIDSLLAENYRNGVLNGTVLVAENGKVVYEKAFGLADMEWNVPNVIDTKSNLASVTKQFVAMLVLQQVEQGKISLDAKITDYLPDYPAKTGSRISIHQLLNHTSGIPNFTDLPPFDALFSRTSYPSPESFVEVFSDSALDFEPGLKYSYNNSAYFLLGVILEKVTGKPFAVLLQEKILGPLHMANTGMDDQSVLLPKRAVGYNHGMLSNMHSGVWDRSSLYTAGGMYSTVGDLLIWDQALYTDKLLPAKYRDLLFKQTSVIDSVTGYGYGWFLKRIALNATTNGAAGTGGTGNKGVAGGADSISIVYHTGTITGFNALIYRVPATRRTFICLSNMLVGRDNLIAMARGCINILYGRPYDHPKQSLAAKLGSIILAEGISAAVKKFDDLKNRNDRYSLVEDEVNTLGYELLRSDKTAEAVEVFKLNTGAFPKSSNAHDSLGDAYAKSGNTSLAIANYKMAFELDPMNIGSVEKMKMLQSK